MQGKALQSEKEYILQFVSSRQQLVALALVRFLTSYEKLHS